MSILDEARRILGLKPGPRSPLPDPQVLVSAQLPGLPAQATPIVIAMLGKGGTGKTTSATSMATIAAAMGYVVWLIDADPQGSAVLWNKGRPTKNLQVLRCAPGNINQALAAAAQKRVDLVIIDNSPVRHRYAMEIAAAADAVFLYCGPAVFDLGETATWLGHLKKIEVRAHVVLSLAQARREDADAPFVVSARKYLAGILRGSGSDLWAGQLTRRNSVIEAAASGLSTAERQKWNAAGNEYRALWRYMIKCLPEDGK